MERNVLLTVLKLNYEQKVVLLKINFIDSIGSNNSHPSESAGSQGQVSNIMPESASTSIEKMSEKFKRKLRHTLNSMDQHSSGGMPAVQRARASTKRKGRQSR